MTEYVAALIALAGNACLSLGMVLQKKNVGWFGFKGRKDRRHRAAKYGWILGFTLMNAHPIFNYFALLGLPPNVVAAMVGTNVAFTSILAAVLLGERLPPRRIGAIVVIFGAVATLGLRGGSARPAAVVDNWLYFFGGFPLAIAAFCALFRRSLKGPVFPTLVAAVAGSLGGYMVLVLKALQITRTSPIGWFATPYIYLYIVAGISAFSLIQLAFKSGDVSAVSPADYGMQVLWPAISSYFVFAMRFDFVQMLCIALIIAAMLLIPDVNVPGASRIAASPPRDSR